MRKRRFIGPSLTPMIDVVFLLLLFFMLTSQFKNTQSIPLMGGYGSTAELAENTPPILIELGQESFVNLEPVTMNEILDMISSLEKTSVAIRSDETISVDKLVGLMDALRELGFEDIVLVEKK